jgi:hypothetical protein
MEATEQEIPIFRYDDGVNIAVELSDDLLDIILKHSIGQVALYDYPCGERLAHETVIDRITFEQKMRANEAG